MVYFGYNFEIKCRINSSDSIKHPGLVGSGEDGLDFYRVITHLWQPALRPGGHLLFEVGIGQAEKVAWLMVKAGYENIRITRDTGGIDRVVEGQRPKDREIPDPLHDTTEEEG